MTRKKRANVLQRLNRRYPFLRIFARKLLYVGNARYCPVCKSHVRRFFDYGLVPRPNACCPVCKSLERHRQVWLYLQQTNLFDHQPKTMLHIAPEFMFAVHFANIPNIRYITADLSSHNVREHIDLTAIPHPDASFDVIYCSHVLEHIPDDRQAMHELRRILRPDGWALIDVPITTDTTFEDPSVTDPKERERLFGQHDHVRRYGLDVMDRLKEAGFHSKAIYAIDLVAENKLTYMGLNKRCFFVCTKEGKLGYDPQTPINT